MATRRPGRLTPEQFERVRSERSLGARVAQLREIRGYPRQKDFLAGWPSLTGEPAPSKTWLSLVESGQLEVSDEKRSVLIRAFQLKPEDEALLDSIDESLPSAGLVRYAAWQAARLEMGVRLCGTRSGDELLRGRKVMADLGNLLRKDPDVRRALGPKASLSLEEFDGLLTAEEKWMLVVETAFMDPFMPYQPFDPKWGAGRLDHLAYIGSLLGLRAKRDTYELIERTREPKLLEWFLDQELKNAQLAAADVTDAMGRRALMTGGALVGTLGWDFACGTFLTRLREVEPLDERDPEAGASAYFPWSGVLAEPVPDTVLTGSPIGAPLIKVLLDAISDGRLARLTGKAEAAAALSRSPDLTHVDLAAFLNNIGSQVAKLEIAKLTALLKLRRSAPGSFPAGGYLPPTRTVKDQLDIAKRVLEGDENRRTKYERVEAPARQGIRSILEALEKCRDDISR